MKSFGLYLIAVILAFHAWTQPPRLVLPIGHTGRVNSIAYSYQGDKIVTTSDDATAKIWESKSGMLLTEIRSYDKFLDYAEFSRDGKRILTNSKLGASRIWNAITGEMIAELPFPKEHAEFAKFSPDGQYIVTSHGYYGPIIWDGKTGKLLVQVDTRKKGNITSEFVTSAGFSPDNKKLLAVFQNGSASVFDVKTGKHSTELEIEKLAGKWFSAEAAAFSSDGKKIVTGLTDNTARVWDTNTGRMLLEFNGHTGFVTNAEFAKSDSIIITKSKDSTIRIWNSKTGQQLVRLADPSHDFGLFCISPDCNTIATVGARPDAYTIKLWDATTGKLTGELKRHKDYINSIAFSPNNRNIASASSDNTAAIWDVKTGNKLATLTGHLKIARQISFLPEQESISLLYNNRYGSFWNMQNATLTHTQNSLTTAYSISNDRYPSKVATASYDKSAIVYDIFKGSVIAKLVGHTGGVNEANLSPDQTRVVTASNDSTARIWDAESGKLSATLIGHTGAVQTSSFSKDGKMVLTTSKDGTVRIWSSSSGKLLLNLPDNPNPASLAGFIPTNYNDTNSIQKFACSFFSETTRVWSATAGQLLYELKGLLADFSPDGMKIATLSQRDTAICIWNSMNGELIIKLRNEVEPGGNSQFVTKARFSPDGSKILTTSKGLQVKLWDVNTGQLLADLGQNAGWLWLYYQFSPNGKQIITASEDNTCKIWDTNTGELMYSFMCVDSTDYLVQLPTKFYKSTKGATKLLHYVTRDQKVITFEQLDVKYNRPDKVLEAIGCPDKTMIQSYRNAYLKRIKKLDIDTTAFSDGYSVPETSILNSTSIPSEQSNEALPLHITGGDSSYLLDRFNIWVNDVPIYGMKGISIRHRQTHFFDTTISIRLSEGENRIETSVLNVNGTESYLSPLFVKYTPAVPKNEKVHFIGIGINQFANSDYNLTWSVKDIRDLAAKLKDHYGEQFSADTLFDDHVTRENVLVLKRNLQSFSEDDKVIVAYSGHGVLSKDLDYFLSTYNITFEHPEEKGLPYDDLESLMDGIKPRKKLMLIDACHSGEVDKDEIARIDQSQQRLDSKGITHKSTIKIVSKQTLGMANSFELMQNLFVNVAKGTGTTIISAAGGMQYAQERGDLKNGVFTFCILDAFQQNKSLTVSQLKKIVTEKVPALTNGLQKPTSRNETINADWQVW